jgi:hypothetical protein
MYNIRLNRWETSFHDTQILSVCLHKQGILTQKGEGSFVLLNEDKNNSHTNYLSHHSNLDCTKEIKGPNEVIVGDHPLHIRSAQCYRPHQRDDFQTYGNKKKRWTIII